MIKLMTLGLMGLFLIGFVSSYVCIYPSVDNDAVKDFKMKINELAVEKDISNGITQEGFNLKLKYFSPCKNIGGNR